MTPPQSAKAHASVAVLIPVFRNQEGLDRTLASLAPEVPNFEVVVVDDGSNPPITVDPERWSFRVTLLRLPTNRGIEGALNNGLAHIFAAGFAYVARIDAGDLWISGRLAAQREFLDNYPDHAIVSGWTRAVGARGDILYNVKGPAGDRAIRRAMMLRNCFQHVSVMMRVSALKECGVYDPAFKRVEDYELFRRLMRRHKAAMLQTNVCDYEVDPERPNISLANRRQQILGRLKVLRAHPNWGSPWFYLGLAHALVLLIAPQRALVLAKRILWGTSPLTKEHSRT